MVRLLPVVLVSALGLGVPAGPALAQPVGAVDGVAAVPPPSGTPAGAPSKVDLVPGASAVDGRGVPLVDEDEQRPAPARYGLGVRSRWISVPRRLLKLFLDESVPLSSYTIGAEAFRRSGNFQFVLGVAWQSLAPSDGNWLGKGSPAQTATDFVEFKGLGAISVDAAFIHHADLNPYVGFHYGGGVGIGIVTGKILRTSAGSSGCATDPGNVAACFPIVCPSGPCREADLKASEGTGPDSAASPSRTEDRRVPTAYPIVNVVTGLDFHDSRRPELDFRVDVGYFFPYFFVGGGVTYRL